MNTVSIIGIAIGIAVVSIFVTGEVMWYYANQEFEEVREGFKESLENPFEEQDESISEIEPTSEPESVVKIHVEETSEPTQNCSGTARCITGTVTKVTDGDTINIDNQAIRFSLASAPELSEVNGPEARSFINEICPIGSAATVDEDDGQTEGSYDRILGVIYCNGVNLNLELLDSGLGYLSSGFCSSSEFASHSWAIKHGC